MNKKILTVTVIVVILLAIIGTVLYLYNRNASYEEYIQPDNSHVSIIQGSDGTAYVSGYSGDTNDESDYTKVLKVFAGLGYNGGVIHNTYETIGEGDVPQIVIDNGAEDWYTVLSDDGAHNAIVINGEVLVDN